jgi:hypothetical protein
MSNLTKILSFKPDADDKALLVACPKDDPEATLFEVHHPGMAYSTSAEKFATLRDANHFCALVEAIHAAGVKAAKSELSTWLNGGRFGR